MAKKTKPTVEKIREYREELVGSKGSEGYYTNLRGEQEIDDGYYNDTFPVPNISNPNHIRRPGSAARICDSIVWHINTSNPQAIREPRRNGDVEEKRATKITTLLNHWLKLLIEEIEEAVKNGVRRGEAFFQIEYNENYDPTDSNNLPVYITAPEPMIVYADPHEYRGVPRQVVKSCRMTVSQVKQMWPDWTNPENRDLNDKDGVDYFAWWDKDWRYAEADGVPLFKGGVQENVLGMVPFVHCASGFGKRSPGGKPEDKYRGLLKPLRGRLLEECEIESRIDSQIDLFTDPFVKLAKSKQDADPEPSREEVKFGAGQRMVVPYGWDIHIEQGQIPSPQMFQHLYQIKQALGEELPPIAQGLPSTSRATGRQEDIYGEHYRQRFEKLIGNVERALAVALGIGLRYLTVVPVDVSIRATEIKDGKESYKEEKVTKADIDGYYDCQVKLQSKDSDRDFMKYRLLAEQQRISWETLLVEGLGWTQDRAQQEITNTLVETVWRNNPQLLEMVLNEALEEAGQTSLLKKMAEQKAKQAQSQQLLAGMPPAQPRPSEAQNPMAADILRQVLNEGGAQPRESGAGYIQEA